MKNEIVLKKSTALTEENKNRIYDFVNAILRSAVLDGTVIEEEEVFAKAQLMANQLHFIPGDYIERVCSVARLYSPNPKIFHLNKAWREEIVFEYNREKETRKKAKPSLVTPKKTKEEEFELWRSNYIRLYKNRVIKVKPEILAQYNISSEEIK